jgi:hypothetical protein
MPVGAATIKNTKCTSWANVNWAKTNRLRFNDEFSQQNNKGDSVYYGVYNSYYSTRICYVPTMWANRLLSVRQVCQINSGRKTPGVDQKVFVPAKRSNLFFFHN